MGWGLEGVGSGLGATTETDSRQVCQMRVQCCIPKQLNTGCLQLKLMRHQHTFK